MCLTRVTSKAWKVVLTHMYKPSVWYPIFLHKVGAMSVTNNICAAEQPFNQWLTSTDVDIKATDESIYRAGFHLLTCKSEADEYRAMNSCRFISKSNEYRLLGLQTVKVLFDRVVALGTQEYDTGTDEYIPSRSPTEVIVAQRILVYPPE